MCVAALRGRAPPLFAARPRLVARERNRQRSREGSVEARRRLFRLLRRFVVSGLAETRLGRSGGVARGARARGPRSRRRSCGAWSGSWRRTRTGTRARKAVPPRSGRADRLLVADSDRRAVFAGRRARGGRRRVRERHRRRAPRNAARGGGGAARVRGGPALVRPRGRPRGRRLPNGPVQPGSARARGRAGVGGSLGGVARRLRRAHEGGREARRGAGDERRVPAGHRGRSVFRKKGLRRR